MTTLKHFSIISLAILILACGNNTAGTSESSGITLPAKDSINSATTIQSVNSEGLNKTSSVGTTGDVKTPGAVQSTALNPAHGEPGHRCDIPVGSPLNSKPAQPPLQNTQVTPSQVITQPNNESVQPAGTTLTGPGINPAHGQPGHRCDIPVGSPLNSKPTQLTTPQNNTLNVAADGTVLPAKPDSTKNQ